MGKNILVFLGSLRRGGNSDALAEAFAKGAKAKGHPQSFACSTLAFELMTQFQNWRNAGVLTVGEVIEKRDVMKKDGYVQAEQLGLSL